MCSLCVLVFYIELSLFFCRLLVERIFAQYMVPHNLETTERMKCLYYLYATLDLNAVKYVSNVKLCCLHLLQYIGFYGEEPTKVVF